MFKPTKKRVCTNPDLAQEYNSALDDLTINSKPIINNLTVIADENKESASDIVALIENRVSNNQPAQKLPVLYLIDSILKNVRGVYIKLFSHNVVKTFCDAFAQVESPVRKQLMVLFETWVTGHIFPEPTLSEIQSNIKKIEMEKAQNHVHVNPAFLKTPNQRASPQPHSQPKAPEVHKPPTSQLPANSGLHPLPTVPIQGVSPLHQPMTPGIGLIPSTALPGLSPTIPPSFFPGAGGNMPSGHFVSVPVPGGAVRRFIPFQRQAVPQQMITGRSSGGAPRGGGPAPTGGRSDQSQFWPPNGAPADPSQILRTLLNPNLSSVLSKVTNPQEQQMDWKKIGTASKEKPATLIEELYKESNQCTQCGLRFVDPQKMDAHYDWHFRCNRREKEKSKVAISRNWFIPVDFWILTASEAGTNEQEQPQQPNPTTVEQPPPQVYITFAREDQMECPACGERFDEHFDPDQDQWINLDSVIGPGDLIYHLKCIDTDQLQNVVPDAQLGDEPSMPTPVTQDQNEPKTPEEEMTLN